MCLSVWLLVSFCSNVKYLSIVSYCEFYSQATLAFVPLLLAQKKLLLNFFVILKFKLKLRYNVIPVIIFQLQFNIIVYF